VIIVQPLEINLTIVGVDTYNLKIVGVDTYNLNKIKTKPKGG